MATFLITGANRGIGLEFARQLAGKGHTILGTGGKPDEAADLARLVHQVITLDVAEQASIDKLPGELKDRPIDVLINNAGVSSGANRLADLTADELQRVFAVNAFAAPLVTKAVMKNLRAGEKKTIFNITSQLGSIANNTRGGSSYAYRGSKAALNMLAVSMHHELKRDGFTCVVVHPGWVQTDMGGANATLKPEESVSNMLTLLEKLTPADSGKFFSYDGKPLPW